MRGNANACARTDCGIDMMMMITPTFSHFSSGAAMRPEDFVGSIIDAYEQSRFPTWTHAKLSRGESRSVSSISEDLLAHYLVLRIPAIEHLYINQPMTTHDGLRIKPDLMVCGPSEAAAFIDVKMDLGYKRNEFEGQMRQMDERIRLMRGQTLNFKAGDRTARAERSLRLSPRGKNLYVVISDLNISAARFDLIAKAASSLSHTRLFALTRSCHPNDRLTKEQVLARIHICHEAFEALEQEVRTALDSDRAA